MSERGIVVTAAIIGAAFGGTVAYLALTGRGRQSRDRLETWLEQAMREVGHVSRLAQQVQRIAANSVQEWDRWRGGPYHQHAPHVQ